MRHVVGGHFDAVGFGDPSLGFQATRELLRASVEEGRRVAETAEFIYFALETPEGCGLVAATDRAGFLLNGCPYFRGDLVQRATAEGRAVWDQSEPHQGGATARLHEPGGAPGLVVTYAVPCFAATQVEHGREQSINLIGLGYRATSHANERRLPPDGQPSAYFRPAAGHLDLPPNRRANVQCRGRIERARFLTNSRTGARLAYALLDCDEARLEVVIDVPSLEGGLAEGAYVTGSFWLVGRAA